MARFWFVAFPAASVTIEERLRFGTGPRAREHVRASREHPITLRMTASLFKEANTDPGWRRVYAIEVVIGRVCPSFDCRAAVWFWRGFAFSCARAASRLSSGAKQRGRLPRSYRLSTQPATRYALFAIRTRVTPGFKPKAAHSRLGYRVLAFTGAGHRESGRGRSRVRRERAGRAAADPGDRGDDVEEGEEAQLLASAGATRASRPAEWGR